MKYYIGIDIGTTSTKAVAFSEDGDIIARESIGYDIQHPQPNFSEQDPVEIFEAVVNSIDKITSSLITDTAVLISFSAAMHSMLAIDENGAPLTNCIIWADNRASEIAGQLRQTDLGHIFYHKTGVPIHAMSPFCKLLWLKKNNTEIFEAAYKFIGIKEYVFYRLFGNYKVDTAVASATGLLNINTLQWDKDILDYTGIQPKQLSETVRGVYTEHLLEGSNYSSDIRLQRVIKTAFVIGGSDGALANLGSGAIGENAMAITIGTSSAVRMVSSSVYTDIQMRIFCYHLANNSYIIGGASSNGAVVLQWLKDALLQTTQSHEVLFEQAAKIDAGCNGLLFIPYILGERAPVWNSNAKGVFFGLDIIHTRAHLIRATMEGIVYCVYSIGKVLMENRTVNEIHATGGFTQSNLWLQILCDMFNCKVCVSGAVESSALGAVKIGLEALGIQKTWTTKIMDTYHPNLLQHQIYVEQFEKFERIYALLKSEMKTNANMS